MMFWAAIIGNVLAFIDTGFRDETSLFYLFFVAPFIAYGYVTLVHRRQRVFLHLTLRNFKKDTDVEFYVTTIFHLIENRGKVVEF
jgi:hypothetical protein